MTPTLFDEVEKAAKVLSEGGLILYPTDTIWGIGADATDPAAVARIYELKQREDSKSMLVLTDSLETLARWVEKIPEEALRLINTTTEPLTVIYDSPVGIAENLRADDGSLGIRITAEEFSRQLCRKFGKPIVSTSANISGEPSARQFSEISGKIMAGVDYVVNYRRDDPSSGRPSRIVKVASDGTTTVIR